MAQASDLNHLWHWDSSALVPSCPAAGLAGPSEHCWQHNARVRSLPWGRLLSGASLGAWHLTQQIVDTGYSVYYHKANPQTTKKERSLSPSFLPSSICNWVDDGLGFGFWWVLGFWGFVFLCVLIWFGLSFFVIDCKC